MNSESQDPDQQHPSFQLTPEGERPPRHRYARAAIIAYFVTLFLTALMLCTCPEAFLLMAGLAIVAFVFGSRLQRVVSALLLAGAIAGFVVEYRQEAKIREKMRRMKQLHEERMRQH